MTWPISCCACFCASACMLVCCGCKCAMWQPQCLASNRDLRQHSTKLLTVSVKLKLIKTWNTVWTTQVSNPVSIVIRAHEGCCAARGRGCLALQNVQARWAEASAACATTTAAPASSFAGRGGGQVRVSMAVGRPEGMRSWSTQALHACTGVEL